MDFKIVWSPEAIQEHRSIAEYIKRDSEFYARSVVTKILDVSRSIKFFPSRGRIVPEVGDDNIRELFVYS